MFLLRILNYKMKILDFVNFYKLGISLSPQSNLSDLPDLSDLSDPSDWSDWSDWSVFPCN